MDHPSRRRFRHEALESRTLFAVDGFAPIDGVGNNGQSTDIHRICDSRVSHWTHDATQ